MDEKIKVQDYGDKKVKKSLKRPRSLSPHKKEIDKIKNIFKINKK